MTKVYISFIDNLIAPTDFALENSLRAEYVCSILDEKRREQSYFAWKLLEYALKIEGVEKPNFYKKGNKWGVLGDEIYFSITHSHYAVAVAISKDLVGVDVEKITEKLLPLKKKFSDFIEGEDELVTLAKFWTGSEARYKRSAPAEINNYIFTNNMDRYCLSVCSDDGIEINEVNDFI